MKMALSEDTKNRVSQKCICSKSKTASHEIFWVRKGHIEQIFFASAK